MKRTGPCAGFDSRGTCPLTTLLVRCTSDTSVSASRHKFNYDAAREQAILDKISGRAGEMGEYARQLYREIMQLSRVYQEQLLTDGSGFSRSAAEKGEA